MRVAAADLVPASKADGAESRAAGSGLALVGVDRAAVDVAQ